MIDWLFILGLLLVAGIGVFGYRIVKRLLPSEDSDFQQSVLYVIGVGLVALPLSLYWANFLGLTIDSDGVLIVLGIVLVVEIIGDQAVTQRRKLLAKHSTRH